MREHVHAPLVAAAGTPVLTLVRELLQEQRSNLVIVAVSLALGLLLQRLFPASGVAEAVVVLLTMSAFVLTFYVFTRTESNPRRDRRGFPTRYFTLPVSTLSLVAVPLVLGVVAIEAVFAWSWWFELLLEQPPSPVWAAAKLAAFMLTYQMLLWSAARLGAMRMVIIGFGSFVLIVLEFSVANAVLLAQWYVAAFVLSWKAVTRQRSGSSHSGTGVGALIERIGDALPKRMRPFQSIHRAQVWYEWRKVGYLLPLLTGALLLFIIVPLSLFVGSDRSFGFLVFTLLMPALLAVPVGKAFSKADTWTMDTTLSEFTGSSRPLTVPAFLAVRPLSSDAVVIAKLHTAVLSTVLAWLLVLAFVMLWQLGWIEKPGLRNLGRTLWAIQHHSLVPQLVALGLFILFLVLLTWRFLVASLWIGLSGSGRLFTIATVPLVLVPTAGLLLLDEFVGWLRDDATRWQPFVWCVAAVVIGKFWLAAYTWRGIGRAFHRYLLPWTCATACMLLLAALLAEPFGLLLNIELAVARCLLVCAALLVMPLAQLGLAPTSFASNRHG
jgi:hypothetical protein